MSMLQVFFTFMLFAVLGFCLPLYKKMEPELFPAYLIWCGVISGLWLWFIFSTDIFCG